MGLLNHLFGSKKGTAKELVMDDKKRMALWRQHLVNFSKREKLSENFKFNNVDTALKEFEDTLNRLNQIESLISSEIISVGNEKKLDKEILADLERVKSVADIDKLTNILVHEENKQVTILELFREIHNILLAEIHLIRLIKKKPSNVKELLVKLYVLISHQEFRLYKVFKERYYEEEDRSIHKGIVKLANAAILSKKLEEFKQADEEIFVKEIIKNMAPSEGESMHAYRMLAERIFYRLVEMAKDSLSEGEDPIDILNKFEAFLKDNSILYNIIKRLKPKYKDSEIKAVAFAFRRAYEIRHFEDWEGEFVD